MKRLFNLILLVFLFMNSTALVGVLANDDIINGREKIENPNKKGVLFTVENVNKKQDKSANMQTNQDINNKVETKTEIYILGIKLR